MIVSGKQGSEAKPILLHHDGDIAEIRRAHPELTEVDAFSRQLKELFVIEHKEFIGIDKAAAYASDAFQAFTVSKADTSVFVYFPWTNTLVRTVDRDDYFVLKSNRNQDLITAEEQTRLRAYPVAVLGMSVGSNIAFVLTQAGISNRIALADFDALDTTNLNRILAGVHEIGLNKTIVAARRIYEDNPFADVITLPEGASEANLDALLREGTVRCIVEEIDDIPFKIRTRLLAMQYRVPVVMVTDNGDGVVLHVERYDLGHDRIWGKPAGHFAAILDGPPLSREQAGGIIMHDIVGGPHRVDPKMLASVQRVLAKELVSWSQLGSAALLGGVVATCAIKKIALGEATEPDVRAWISPERVEVGTHGAS